MAKHRGEGASRSDRDARNKKELMRINVFPALINEINGKDEAGFAPSLFEMIGEGTRLAMRYRAITNKQKRVTAMLAH